MMLRRPTGDTLHRVVHRMFYTKMGSTFISVIFGFALAIMFQRVCKDRECRIIHPPPMKEIEGTVYRTKPGGDECYTYTTSVVPCA